MQTYNLANVTYNLANQIFSSQLFFYSK